MGILGLGDLNENKPSADVAKAKPEQRPISDQRPLAHQNPVNVGEIPLNNADQRAGAAAESRKSASTGRSAGQRAVAETRLNFPDQGRYRQAGSRVWMALVLVLAFALVAVTGYSYFALRKNNLSLSSLSRWPSTERLVTMLGGRMDSTEARLRGLTSNWDSLADRVAKLDHKLSSNLAGARQQTQQHIAQAEVRMRAEIDTRTQGMDARLARVESDQTAERARLAQMQDQLQTEVTGLRQEVASNRDETGRDLAGLHGQVNQSHSDLRTLAQGFDRRRVNFELVKNSAVELAPGVSLTVLKTDVSYQRFEGYLSLTFEGRTLWLPNMGAQEAVDFYSKQAKRPYDLVVTTVNKRGVAGYLLLPAGESQGGPEAANRGILSTRESLGK